MFGAEIFVAETIIYTESVIIFIEYKYEQILFVFDYKVYNKILLSLPTVFEQLTIMIYRIIFSIAVLVSSLFFVSCEEDGPVIIDPVFGPPKMADNSVVLSYNEFLHQDDVVIVSEDSTKINVNLDYLIKKGIDIKKGDVVCIWRTENTAPFIRKVVKRKNTGTVISMVTEKADVSMLIEDADVVLKSDLMVNYFNETTTPYKKYSIDNVCHPAVIIWNDPKTGEPKSVTADDLIKQNRSWNIMDSTVLLNSKFSGENLSISLTDGSIYLNSGINVSFTINDCKLRRYDCVSTGEININTLMKVNGKNVQERGEVSLYENLGPYTIVFWLGEMPMPVTVDASVHVDLKLEKNAPILFELPMVVDAKYNIGSMFRTIWTPIKDISTKYRSDFEKVTAEKGIEAYSVYTVRIKHKGRIFEDIVSSSTFGYNVSAKWESVPEGIHSVADFTIFGDVNNNAYGANWLISDWDEEFLVVNSQLWDKIEN